MIEKKINNNIVFKIFFILSLGLLLFSPNVYAAQASTGGGVMANIGQMFANGNAAFEALIRLTKVSAYMIGIFLVIGSIFKLSQLGSNPQVSPKTPIIMFVSGISVFALVGVVSIVSQTMAMGDGPGSILISAGNGLDAQTAAAITGVLTFIRLIGYIAFIRGWLLINQSGQGKEGTLGRGLTHILGGVAAINVQITAQILANTFAPGINLPI